MHNHSYENEFNLHVNEISFSYEKMGTKTRFEEEANGNSEMAYFSSSTDGMWTGRTGAKVFFTRKVLWKDCEDSVFYEW